ncbi:MAG: DUF2283 domain-containing protein [Methylomonas sp.]|jgi:uncharacterized protein YuzE
MKVEFDPIADTAYLELLEGDVEQSKQLETGVIADFDVEGRLLGIEILYVSKRATLQPSKQAA